MVAATVSLNTRRKEHSNSSRLTAYPVSASTTIRKGWGVNIDDDGYAVSATADATHSFVGKAVETIANTGADGALSILVEDDLILDFTIDATNAVDATDLGRVVKVIDNQTVANASGTGPNAGVLVEIEGSGSDAIAWVRVNSAAVAPNAV